MKNGITIEKTTGETVVEVSAICDFGVDDHASLLDVLNQVIEARCGDHPHLQFEEGSYTIKFWISVSSGAPDSEG